MNNVKSIKCSKTGIKSIPTCRPVADIGTPPTVNLITTVVMGNQGD